MVLAGGMGERLFPLTRDRAKPAVPFGGRYRIIDFVLNNLVNSGLRKIKVLTQFKSIRTWRLTFDIGEFVDPVPAQMRRGPHWFRGTADAVYQNLNLIFDEEPQHICIFGGDHIYTMDVKPMLLFHQEGDHDLTIAALPVPIAEASRFGILEVDASGRVVGFEEKPKAPKAIPSLPDLALASMGNYVFKARSSMTPCRTRRTTSGRRSSRPR
jgi:glucose-1-phosphate adenylyltransferase